MIEDALALLASSSPAEALRASRYAYPVVNAVHIMGLATLFGSILALDLRLLGLFRSFPAAPLARLLPRVAFGGLIVAAASGVMLFSVEPQDYAANPFFLAKLALVSIGVVHALSLRFSSDWRALVAGRGEITPSLRASGVFSIAVWAAAILAGRFIAFV